MSPAGSACRAGSARCARRNWSPGWEDGTPLGDTGKELALLEDIGSVTRDASICGLGQTAVSAVQSAVRLGLIR